LCRNANFRRLLTQVEGLTCLIEDLRVVGLADSGHFRLQWRMADISEAIRITHLTGISYIYYARHFSNCRCVGRICNSAHLQGSSLFAVAPHL